MAKMTFLLVCALLIAGCAASNEKAQPDETALAVQETTPEPAEASGAGGEPPDSITPEPPNPSTPEPAEASGADGELPNPEDTLKEIMAEADALQGVVENIRGLKFNTPVPQKIISQEEWKEFLSKSIEKELPQEKIDGLAESYKLLHLIPEDYNLDEGIEELYSEQAAAFYDTEGKYLSLIRTADGGVKGVDASQAGMFKQLGLSPMGILISHELTHALEDQHFDITKFSEANMQNDDSALAMSAVVEGNATLIMFEYVITQLTDKIPMYRNLPADKKKEAMKVMRQTLQKELTKSAGEISAMMPQAGAQAFTSAPEFMKESMVFPYFGGFKLSAQILDLRDTEGLDMLYSDPPQSTEQVLHPEKYFDKRDFPVQIDLPEFEGLSAYKEIYRNTLGEFGTRHVIMEFFNDKNVVSTVSEGWDGDQFATYNNPLTGKSFIVWITCWDAAKDAREFYSTYKILVHNKYKADTGLSQKNDPERNCITWTASNGSSYIERRDNAVLVIECIPEKDLESTVQTAWKYTQKELVKEIKLKK